MKRKYQGLPVSTSKCKELGNNNSMLTTTIKLDRPKNEELFLDVQEGGGHRVKHCPQYLGHR